MNMETRQGIEVVNNSRNERANPPPHIDPQVYPAHITFITLNRQSYRSTSHGNPRLSQIQIATIRATYPGTARQSVMDMAYRCC
ncbi:hypothetical protein E2C01_088299 [Portunus trituberculatus]|uniref:Uncharacterized protein n=1 Tax=Portunus trituberculatus TaxID=210409 RepID=A0A5B7JJ06_PORTR|nr:hypothetical protein [Portunus trituberculatus]